MQSPDAAVGAESGKNIASLFHFELTGPQKVRCKAHRPMAAQFQFQFEERFASNPGRR